MLAGKTSIAIIMAALFCAQPDILESHEGEALKQSLARSTITVHPQESHEVLINPGIGFADFHFGFGRSITREEYPPSSVAYFRWSWADLEPFEGEYNFGLVDEIIQQAKAKNETLAFRIISHYKNGPPQWLLEKGVPFVEETSGKFPDYNDPTFLTYHERLIQAFGRRYADSPDIDHVDIGSVGCWGEWNTACCQGTEAQCKQYFPTHENQIKMIDWYVDYFPNTPLVMLHGDVMRYANSRGAGWRGDCFGDYGYFRPDWNHMEHVYTQALRDPVTVNAWKSGPVQFEVCGVMQDWYDKGFDIDLILQRGLEWHVSVLNAKSSPVPTSWRSRIDNFLKKMGYRMVLREMTHTVQVSPGGPLLLRSRWENVGVAPMYHPWPLGYRIRSDSSEIVAQWVSHADVKRWLPGAIHEVEDIEPIPQQVAPGTYSLDVAILREDGVSAGVDLAIEGKRDDRWYEVSNIVIH